VVQARLRSGTTHRTAWIDPKAHVGDQVTLKNSEDPDRRWDVLELSEPQRAGDINRGWNNNI
jgi:hypothetical protein